MVKWDEEDQEPLEMVDEEPLEVKEENKLQVIVKESGLEKTKAKQILERFQDYFNMTDEYTKKARAIVVTDENQKVEMQMARTIRLFLVKKRTAIEKSRKELKEQAMREGKAIDGIANVLKALIVPIEEHLDKQEKFVEIKVAEEAEVLRLEVEKRIIEEKRVAEEKEKEEQERIILENIKLKEEAEKAEKERLKQEAALKKQKDDAEKKSKEAELKAQEEKEKIKAEAEAEQKGIIEKARIEKEKLKKKAEVEHKKQEKKLADEKVKAEALRKKAEEKARLEKEAEAKKAEAEHKEKERLAEILKNQIECPFCHKKFQREEK